jgi:hypothetical protein
MGRSKLTKCPSRCFNSLKCSQSYWIRWSGRPILSLHVQRSGASQSTTRIIWPRGAPHYTTNPRIAVVATLMTWKLMSTGLKARKTWKRSLLDSVGSRTPRPTALDSSVTKETTANRTNLRKWNFSQMLLEASLSTPQPPPTRVLQPSL